MVQILKWNTESIESLHPNPLFYCYCLLLNRYLTCLFN